MSVKYNTIGKTYNLTRKADPYLLKRLYFHLNPKDDGRYLDIGCGSGNYTSKLQELGLSIIGIDPSIEMLQKARSNNSNIEYQLGIAENIQLPDNSIDGIIAFLTIHHWTNIEKGFQEIGRVLKPGGRLVIFHSTPKQMKGYWLNEYFPNMLEDSMALMHTSEVIEKVAIQAEMQLTSTEDYTVDNNLQDLFLQCGKYQPEMYFRPDIRKGISSFAAVANKEEVDNGLRRLKGDINSGRIDKVIDRYENDVGDYLYIVFQKKNNKKGATT